MPQDVVIKFHAEPEVEDARNQPASSGPISEEAISQFTAQNFGESSFNRRITVRGPDRCEKSTAE